MKENSTAKARRPVEGMPAPQAGGLKSGGSGSEVALSEIMLKDPGALSIPWCVMSAMVLRVMVFRSAPGARKTPA